MAFRRLLIPALLLLAVSALDAEALVAEDSTVWRYHERLQQNPRPGYLFERFYAAWLEEASLRSLEDHLKSRAEESIADAMLLSIFYHRIGEERKAGRHLDEILTESSDAPWPRLLRAEIRMARGEHVEAIDDLERILPENSEMEIRIGWLRGECELSYNSVGAASYWKDWLQQHEDDDGIWEDTIDLLWRRQFSEAAVAFLRELTERTSDPHAKVQRQLWLADLLQRSGAEDEARDLLKGTLAQTGQGSWMEETTLGRLVTLNPEGDRVAALEALAAEFPGRILIAERLAHALLRAGDDREALETFRGILARTPGEIAVRERFLLFLEQASEFETGVEECQNLLQQVPERRDLRWKLATLQYHAGDNLAAAETVQAWLQDEIDRPADHEKAARLLESFQLVQDAEIVWVAACVRFPEETFLQEHYADFLFREERDEEALKFYATVSEDADRNGVLRIARVLAGQGHEAEAMEILENYLARGGSTDLPILELLASCARAAGQIEKALDWTLDALPIAQTIAELEGVIQRVRNLGPAMDGTEDVLSRLEERPDPSPAARSLRAQLLHDLNRKEEAIALLKNVETGGHPVFALHVLSRVHRADGDVPQAIRALEALVRQPGQSRLRGIRTLVSLQEKEENWAEALRWVQEWHALTPGSPRIWRREAELLEKADQPEDAIILLRRAAREFEDNPQMRASLAALLERQGRHLEAEEIYWALYEDSGFQLSWIQSLFRAASESGRTSEVVEKLEARRDQNRKSIHPLLALARTYELGREESKRAEALRRASEIEPENVQVLLMLSSLQNELGQWTEAMATLEQAHSIQPIPEVAWKIVETLLSVAEFEESFERAILLMQEGKLTQEQEEVVLLTFMEYGEYQYGLQMVDQLVLQRGDSSAFQHLRGVLLEESDQHEAAAKIYLKLLDEAISQGEDVWMAGPEATRGFDLPEGMMLLGQRKERFRIAYARPSPDHAGYQQGYLTMGISGAEHFWQSFHQTRDRGMAVLPRLETALARMTPAQRDPWLQQLAERDAPSLLIGIYTEGYTSEDLIGIPLGDPLLRLFQLQDRRARAEEWLELAQELEPENPGLSSYALSILADRTLPEPTRQRIIESFERSQASVKESGILEAYALARFLNSATARHLETEKLQHLLTQLAEGFAQIVSSEALTLRSGDLLFQTCLLAAMTQKDQATFDRIIQIEGQIRAQDLGIADGRYGIPSESSPLLFRTLEMAYQKPVKGLIGMVQTHAYHPHDPIDSHIEISEIAVLTDYLMNSSALDDRYLNIIQVIADNEAYSFREILPLPEADVIGLLANPSPLEAAFLLRVCLDYGDAWTSVRENALTEFKDPLWQKWFTSIAAPSPQWGGAPTFSGQVIMPVATNSVFGDLHGDSAMDWFNNPPRNTPDLMRKRLVLEARHFWSHEGLLNINESPVELPSSDEFLNSIRPSSDSHAQEWAWFGYICWRLGEYEEAEEALSISLARRPDLKPVRLSLLKSAISAHQMERITELTPEASPQFLKHVIRNSSVLGEDDHDSLIISLLKSNPIPDPLKGILEKHLADYAVLTPNLFSGEPPTRHQASAWDVFFRTELKLETFADAAEMWVKSGEAPAGWWDLLTSAMLRDLESWQGNGGEVPELLDQIFAMAQRFGCADRLDDLAHVLRSLGFHDGAERIQLYQAVANGKAADSTAAFSQLTTLKGEEAVDLYKLITLYSKNPNGGANLTPPVLDSLGRRDRQSNLFQLDNCLLGWAVCLKREQRRDELANYLIDLCVWYDRSENDLFLPRLDKAMQMPDCLWRIWTGSRLQELSNERRRTMLQNMGNSLGFMDPVVLEETPFLQPLAEFKSVDLSDLEGIRWKDLTAINMIGNAIVEGRQEGWFGLADMDNLDGTFGLKLFRSLKNEEGIDTLIQASLDDIRAQPYHTQLEVARAVELNLLYPLPEGLGEWIRPVLKPVHEASWEKLRTMEDGDSNAYRNRAHALIFRAVRMGDLELAQRVLNHSSEKMALTDWPKFWLRVMEAYLDDYSAAEAAELAAVLSTGVNRIDTDLLRETARRLAVRWSEDEALSEEAMKGLVESVRPALEDRQARCVALPMLHAFVHVAHRDGLLPKTWTGSARMPVEAVNGVMDRLADVWMTDEAMVSILTASDLPLNQRLALAGVYLTEGMALSPSRKVEEARIRLLLEALDAEAVHPGDRDFYAWVEPLARQRNWNAKEAKLARQLSERWIEIWRDQPPGNLRQPTNRSRLAILSLHVRTEHEEAAKQDNALLRPPQRLTLLQVGEATDIDWSSAYLQLACPTEGMLEDLQDPTAMERLGTRWLMQTRLARLVAEGGVGELERITVFARDKSLPEASSRDEFWKGLALRIQDELSLSEVPELNWDTLQELARSRSSGKAVDQVPSPVQEKKP